MTEPKVSRRFEGGLVKQDVETKAAIRQALAARALRFGVHEDDDSVSVMAYLPDRDPVLLASMPLTALVPDVGRTS